MFPTIDMIFKNEMSRKVVHDILSGAQNILPYCTELA